jgi:5'-methylthioadenosine phosphorylase
MYIFGMTTTPEAQRAREAEMSYAVRAHVTDYDVWHQCETPVTVEMVVQTLLANTAVAKQAVANAIRRLATTGATPQANALRDAIITNRAVVPPAVVERLAPLIGKYFVGN